MMRSNNSVFFRTPVLLGAKVFQLKSHQCKEKYGNLSVFIVIWASFRDHSQWSSHPKWVFKTKGIHPQENGQTDSGLGIIWEKIAHANRTEGFYPRRCKRLLPTVRWFYQNGKPRKVFGPFGKNMSEIGGFNYPPSTFHFTH